MDNILPCISLCTLCNTNVPGLVSGWGAVLGQSEEMKQVWPCPPQCRKTHHRCEKSTKRLQQTFGRDRNWGYLPWSHSSLQALGRKDSGLLGSKWCCRDCVQRKDRAGNLGRNGAGREEKETNESLYPKSSTSQVPKPLVSTQFITLLSYFSPSFR